MKLQKVTCLKLEEIRKISIDELVGDFFTMLNLVNKPVEFLRRDRTKNYDRYQRSMWCPKSSYMAVVRGTINRRLSGVRDYKTMIGLTFDKEKVETFMPDWWKWTFREFLAVCAGDFRKSFNYRLKDIWRRDGKSYPVLTWARHIHHGERSHNSDGENMGAIHYHEILRGIKYLYFKKRDRLKAAWSGSDYDAGLEIGKRADKGFQYGNYLISDYLSTQQVSVDFMEKYAEMYALMWKYGGRSWA